MSIVTLVGENNFLVRQAVHERAEASLKANGPDSIERLDCETADADEVLSRFYSTSLFSPKVLFIVKDMSANKELSEKFVELITKKQPENDLIIVEPKLDKRSKLYAALKSKTEYKEFNQPIAAQLVSWAINWTKQNGGNISTGDADYLIALVGPNQQLIKSELEKLLIFSPKITKESIDSLVEPSPQSTVFNLVNATINRDHKRVSKIYSEQRRLKVEHRMIIGSLAWQLHLIALVKLAESRSLSEISSKSGVSPNQLDDARKLARNISYAELTNAINKLLEIDVKSKREAIDPDDALLYFLLSF